MYDQISNGKVFHQSIVLMILWLDQFGRAEFKGGGWYRQYCYEAPLKCDSLTDNNFSTSIGQEISKRLDKYQDPSVQAEMLILTKKNSNLHPMNNHYEIHRMIMAGTN